MEEFDLDVGVPARGLQAEVYRGHIVRDELLIFPAPSVIPGRSEAKGKGI
jgi:hypothetical protein